MNVKQTNLPGFDIPVYSSITCTYVGTTNNYDTIVYKKGTQTVATLTFTYVGGTPSADDARISTIVKS